MPPMQLMPLCVCRHLPCQAAGAAGAAEPLLGGCLLNDFPLTASPPAPLLQWRMMANGEKFAQDPKVNLRELQIKSCTARMQQAQQQAQQA